MHTSEIMSSRLRKLEIRLSLMGFCFFVTFVAQAQEPAKTWNDGEIENVEIEIVKEREITLPSADRNFEKIPPRPSEPIKPPITYDFKPFSFKAPHLNPQIRPLKLKQESQRKVYGGFLRVEYGNYVSPLLEA